MCKRSNINTLLMIGFLYQLSMLQADIEIDTTFEAAVPSQQNQSFVFTTQQSFDDMDFAYGDIEFRAGVIPTDFNISMTFGMTPPLAGNLDTGPGFCGPGCGYGIV